MMTSFGLGPFYGKKMKILQYQLPSRNPKKSSKPVQVGPERGHCTSLGENHASLSAPRACYKNPVYRVLGLSSYKKLSSILDSASRTKNYCLCLGLPPKANYLFGAL